MVWPMQVFSFQSNPIYINSKNKTTWFNKVKTFLNNGHKSTETFISVLFHDAFHVYISDILVWKMCRFITNESQTGFSLMAMFFLYYSLVNVLSILEIFHLPYTFNFLKYLEIPSKFQCWTFFKTNICF